MIGAVHWFDIPVLDIKRAVNFYSSIFQIELHIEEAGENKMAILQTEKATGSLVQGPGLTPSKTGFMPYFECGIDLNNVLARVEPAGGKVEIKKTDIGEHGFYAIFHDTEGNRFGLQSSK